MQQRRRFKQTESLPDRLKKWSTEVLRQANQLPPGPKRDELLRKRRQAETASHLDEWANSSGLQPAPDCLGNVRLFRILTARRPRTRMNGRRRRHIAPEKATCL
jgi:hypothetical protein